MQFKPLNAFQRGNQLAVFLYHDNHPKPSSNPSYTAKETS